MNCAAERLQLETKTESDAERNVLVPNKHENECNQSEAPKIMQAASSVWTPSFLKSNSHA